MTEQLPFSDGKHEISRRDFLRAMAVGAGAVAVAYLGQELSEGIRLNEYPVDVKDKQIGDVEMRPENIFGKDGGTLGVTGRTLLFDPNEVSDSHPETNFFASGRVFRYIHRANKINVINQACEAGANLFDLDANNVDGTIYAEHGLVPQIGDRRLPLVVDVNERGVKFGRPAHEYEDLVALISLLAREYGRTLGVSAELKRGVFDFDAIHQILDIHQRHGVPVMMHGPDADNILSIGDEIAAIYHRP